MLGRSVRTISSRCTLGPILPQNFSTCRKSTTSLATRPKWPRLTKTSTRHPAGLLGFISSSRRNLATQSSMPSVSGNTEQIASSAVAEEGEEDRLYRLIELEVKGHEDAVLSSYEWFLCRAAEELGITVSRVYVPLRNYERFSLLKSAFVYSNHQVQYEFRTYFRVVQLQHLTGSTADTYLEYVERNLPEGVAMKVITCKIEELPESIAAEQNQAAISANAQ